MTSLGTRPPPVPTLPGLEPLPPSDAELGAAVALANLPRLTPARLRRLIVRHGPLPAFDLVASGAVLSDPWFERSFGRRADERRDLSTRWSRALKAIDPQTALRACSHAGIDVHVLGRPGYPELLADDTDPPAVLFTRGSLGALTGRRAAIVGTRNATAAGRSTATELGRALAEAGVRVVSGLARGIDGAAHRGALSAHAAPPVGIVGSGLDVVYPPEHADLWSSVAQRGLLASESPPGAAPEGWRFPLRNRILAALSEVVVVVESRETGGSLVTADAAAARGVPVMAVPGSVRCRSSAGVNQLLADGCAPVRDALDILVALGLTSAGRPARRRREAEPDDPTDAAVLLHFGSEPLTLDELVQASARPLAEVALAIGRLEQAGFIDRTGGWFERAARR